MTGGLYTCKLTDLLGKTFYSQSMRGLYRHPRVHTFSLVRATSASQRCLRCLQRWRRRGSGTPFLNGVSWTSRLNLTQPTLCTLCLASMTYISLLDLLLIFFGLWNQSVPDPSVLRLCVAAVWREEAHTEATSSLERDRGFDPLGLRSLETLPVQAESKRCRIEATWFAAWDPRGRPDTG